MSPTIQARSAAGASALSSSYAGDAVQFESRPPIGSMAPRAVEFSQPQSPKMTAEKACALPAAGAAVKVAGGDAAPGAPHEYEYAAPGTRPDRRTTWWKPPSERYDTVLPVAVELSAPPAAPNEHVAALALTVKYATRAAPSPASDRCTWRACTSAAAAAAALTMHSTERKARRAMACAYACVLGAILFVFFLLLSPPPAESPPHFCAAPPPAAQPAHG